MKNNKRKEKEVTKEDNIKLKQCHRNKRNKFGYSKMRTNKNNEIHNRTIQNHENKKYIIPYEFITFYDKTLSF